MKIRFLRKIISASFISMSAFVLCGIINYLNRRYLSSNLEVIEYGFLYAAISLLMLIIPFWELGMGKTSVFMISRFMSENKIKRANLFFSYLMMFLLLGSLAVYLLVIACSGIISQYYFRQIDYQIYFIIIALMLITWPLSGGTSVYLLLEKRFFDYSIIQIIRSAFILIILLIPLGAFSMLEIAVAAFPIGGLAALIYGWIQILRSDKFKFFPTAILKISVFKKMIKTGFWISISTCCLLSLNYTDSIMLTSLRGLESTGLYNIALPIMQIACVILVVPRIFIPFLNDMIASAKIRTIKRITLTASFACAAGVVVVYFLGKLLSARIITITFAEKFTPAADTLTILFCSVVVFALVEFYFNLLNSLGCHKIPVIPALSGIAVNVLCNLLLIPRYDIFGAALATFGSYIVIAISAGFICNVKLKKLGKV